MNERRSRGGASVMPLKRRLILIVLLLILGFLIFRAYKLFFKKKLEYGDKVDRIAALEDKIKNEDNHALESKLHKTIKKVSDDIEETKYNTAIAALMTFLNDAEAESYIGKQQYLTLIKLLCPFAPHISEELWQRQGGEGFISVAQWPEYDEAKLVDDMITIGVQVNGKFKASVTLPTDCAEEQAVETACENRTIAAAIEGKKLVKVIYKANKILNLIAK